MAKTATVLSEISDFKFNLLPHFKEEPYFFPKLGALRRMVGFFKHLCSH